MQVRADDICQRYTVRGVCGRGRDGGVNWALIVYGILSAMGLLFSANSHGKPKTGTESFWPSLAGQLIVWALIIWAVYGGKL